MPHVFGLDWISARKGWACCRLELGASRKAAVFSTVCADEAPSLQADAIVLDAPIGLPSHKQEGGALRPCDQGARRLVGPAFWSSVFPAPVAAELGRWRERRAAGIPQGGGHIRGLPPAIASAARVVAAQPEMAAESHPELIFALLAGHFLPETAKENRDAGSLLRLALLACHQVHLGPEELKSGERADYIDSAGMALVARAWAQGTAQAVIDSSGIPCAIPARRPLRDLMLTVGGDPALPRATMPEAVVQGLWREGLAEWGRAFECAT